MKGKKEEDCCELSFEQKHMVKLVFGPPNVKICSRANSNHFLLLELIGCTLIRLFSCLKWEVKILVLIPSLACYIATFKVENDFPT